MTDLRTERGIKLILIHMMLSAIYGILSLGLIFLMFTGIVEVSDLTSLLPYGRTDYDVKGIFFFLGMILLSILLFAIIIGILMYIYQGRKEFGRKNEKFVNIGGGMVIASFIMLFFPYISTFGGFFTQLGMVLFFYNIAGEEERKKAHLGLGIVMTGAFLGFTREILFRGLGMSVQRLYGLQIIIGIITLVAIIPLSIFYYRTWQAIKTGQIEPAKYGRRKKKKRM